MLYCAPWRKMPVWAGRSQVEHPVPVFVHEKLFLLIVIKVLVIVSGGSSMPDRIVLMVSFIRGHLDRLSLSQSVDDDRIAIKCVVVRPTVGGGARGTCDRFRGSS
jgi:hypothetical protein